MANGHMKRYSTWWIFREMQIKTTMTYQLTPIRMAIIKKNTNNKCWLGCRGKGNLVHCWWECKLVQRLWKTLVQKYTCTPMFIPVWFIITLLFTTALVFTIAFTTVLLQYKIWKQPKCVSTDERIKNMWYIYSMED